MSTNQQPDSWIPRTDGRKVWAVNARNGESRQFLHCSSAKIVGVHSAGDCVGIVLENGKTIVWNPRTDSSSMYL